MTGRVHGKVALVTGAAMGLGAEAARRLAQEGAAVLLTDVAADEADALVREIRSAGGQAAFARHDVTSEADWDAAVEAARAEFGALHILVNNAGVSGESTPLIGHGVDDWRRILSINLDGVFLGLRAAGQLIADSGGGSVINVSSILGKAGLANAAAYCASKGGVLQLTKAAALEWAPLGIRVNSLHPGFIETPMLAEGLRRSENGNEMREMLIMAHPLGRLGVPAEIADAILFLASDESRFMTGAELVVDGGYLAR
jgi:NAD(P)-dependent dehydrogenase (short-subunit alcohol dehydrogenase family)